MKEEQIKEVIEDLKILLEKDEILGKDFDEFLKILKTQTVKNYLLSLRKHSQPEQALKESFFSINSIFAKYLFKNLYPEVGGESGFVDYVIKDKREEIKLEIKPLFKAEFEKGKSGEIFKKIKKVKLNWDKHKNQIKKYLGRKRGEYVVLTNLEEWYFFSYSFSYSEDCPYFAKVNLFELLKDFEQVDDFWQYLDRQEELSIKEPLDKRFFSSLKTWVNELKKVNFVVDEKKKTELIIKLINKFIFIQTLDNFWVIDKNYIIENWATIERKWHTKGKFNVIRKFIEEINEFFYDYYDTELFRDEETILDYIEKDESTIETFYNALKLVLGIDYGTSATIWERGVIQYNFRRIDEDILGKAYETFLAEVRKEQGVYYTPKYITQYIVGNTVGKIYDELLEKIKKNLEKKNFNECKKLIQRFISIKVLDPACGSGSFLIKALRLIWDKYNELNKALENEKKKYSSDSLLSQMESKELKEIKSLYDILNFKNNRDKISKIIIRHIHGNDLDANALEVAKVNLWLEAIKLAPKEFRYDKLPADTNHILPDLEMNLGNGDSLVGLPEDRTIEFLKENYKEDLKKLFELRKRYLNDPTDEEAIKEINKIKNKLRKKLNEEFKKYLEENKLPLEILEKTKPFHWALDFWFVFFDENLEPKPKEEQGFDAIIGNPPYERANLIKKWKKFYRKCFITVFGACDIYIPFMEKSIYMLKKGGLFSFITSNKYLVADYGEKLRQFLINYSILELIDLTECPSVFEDAMINPLITIIKKSSPKDVYTKIVIFKKDVPEKIFETKNYSDYDNEFFSIELRIQSHLKDEITGHFNIYLTPKIRKILDKIYNSSQLFKDLSNIRTGIMGFDYHYLSSIILDKEEKEENELELLPPSLIERYRILWGKKSVKLFDKDFKYPKIKYDEKLINSATWNLFKNKKIVIRGVARRLSAAYDEKGRAIFVAVHASISDKLDPEYQLALLNSKLFNWIHIIKYYSARIPEGSLRYPVSFIESLPIKIDTSFAKRIEKFIHQIITLKKLQHKFRELWRYYSRKFRNNYRSLGEILLDDKRAIQEGNFDKIWISDASVYPDEIPEKEIKKIREILAKNPQSKLKFEDKSNTVKIIITSSEEKKFYFENYKQYKLAKFELLGFKRFRIVGEGNEKLKIYGIDGQKEEILLEITTSKKEFREIIYLELLELLDSRVKKKTLKDILSKSEISVIQPNIWENSGNLIKITKQKFNEWLEKENLEIREDDIVKIDNEIQEVDNLIDAHVFRLYRLTKEEVEIVLDSLNVIESVKNDILGKFEKIK